MVTDASGVLTDVNDAAVALFPAARAGSPLEDSVPDWLLRAHADAPQAAAAHTPSAELPVSRGQVGERSFAARPQRTAGGEVVWWLVEETDLRKAEQALRDERARAALLAETSNVLLSSLNVERSTEATARMAAAHLADAVVIVAPARGRRFPVTYCRGDGPVTQDVLDLDPGVLPGLKEALQGFPPVPSRWIDPAAVPSWAVPEGFEGPIGSVVITPLPGHGIPAGAIVLLRRSDRGSFTEAEEVFARLFAARAGAALSAARMYAEQARITQTLMQDLLPPALTQVHGVDFAGGYRASVDTDRVGGDFYDVHPGADPTAETLAVLGDVCGKGLDAAVLTGKIRHTLQALLPMADSHEAMLKLLNSVLLNSHHTKFATLALASVARHGNRVRLRVTSAGHPAPLIVRGDGTVEEARTSGTLVGALPEVRATTAVTELKAGETCLLYSDGITEARGGPLGDTMFGEERLRRVLAECAGMPAEAIVERVQMLATQWVGSGRHDDMAVLAVTAPTSAHLTAVNGHTRGRFTA